MSEQTKRTCPACNGRKTRVEWYTERETDMTRSLIMGAATGTGYFPMKRDVRKQRTVPCPSCHGTGTVG